ncbi:MAG: ATPase, partial [Rhizobacter sp.]|nr:ATPase [Rhizobacter sp.]
KPDARLSAQVSSALRRVLPRAIWPYLDTGLAHYLMLMAAVLPLLALLFGLLYNHELKLMGEQALGLAGPLRLAFIKAYAALVLVAGIVAWWLVLTAKSREVAQEESNRQTHLLVREIDSHRRTDIQLQAAKRTADLANSAKTRYISTISHELRTPLNSILGYAQLMEQDPTIPPHRKQAVTVIRRGGDHLLSLIEGTLDIARIEGGKLTLEVKPMRFRDCIEQIASLFEPQAASKGIEFVHRLSDAIPEAVRADEKRLRQILINVVGNAVKFTAQGKVEFRVRYQREMAVFEIEDSGPGIAAAEIEQVFEPFARGSAPVSPGSGPGGTGLGLTISKMLCDLMGGEMTVESTPGVGSLFRIKLFLPEARGAAVLRELPRATRTGYVGARRSVLAVDNEEVDRELLASVLEPLGFELRQAASGHECIEMLKHFQPDAILMDLAMPGIDGWQTIRLIREQSLSEAPIAIVSANAFDKILDNDAGIEGRDFILKPVRVVELLDWLGARLGLQWIEVPVEAPVLVVPAAGMTYPPQAQLRALGEQIDLGYVRGILKMLDQIEANDASALAFVGHMRGLARQFQLEAMAGVIKEALDDATA